MQNNVIMTYYENESALTQYSFSEFNKDDDCFHSFLPQDEP